MTWNLPPSMNLFLFRQEFFIGENSCLVAVLDFIDPEKQVILCLNFIFNHLVWYHILSKRIIYKILLLTYKSLRGLAPDYLKDLLDQYVPTRTLRSGSKHLLCVPRVRTKNYGERAFSFCGPKLWNDLPSSIKQATSVDIFKKELKTFLFNKDVNF